jgi:hypothetical protein
MIAASYFSARHGVGLIQAVGWLGVAFFGLCFVAILSQLFRHGPTIVIDELGVFDRRMGLGRIPWGDIASVSVAEIKSQRLISLWLRNEALYLSQGSAWRRKLAAANRALGFSPFCVSFTGLTPGFDEAYTRLKARVPERASV